MVVRPLRSVGDRRVSRSSCPPAQGRTIHARSTASQKDPSESKTKPSARPRGSTASAGQACSCDLSSCGQAGGQNGANHGRRQRDHLLDYSSTKGAIVAFTRSLGEQLAPKGIRINGVASGPVWTP